MSKAEIRSIVAYTADPWESCLPILRYRAAAELLGWHVFQGKVKEQIFPDLVDRADLVVIQRDFPRFREEYKQIIHLARSLGKPVIYEIDDLLLELPNEHISKGIISDALFAILEAIVNSDLVITSTTFLEDYLKPLNPRIHVIPNYLDDRIWQTNTKEYEEHVKEPVHIQFMGGKTHYADLVSIVPAFQYLLDHFPNVVLSFIGCQPPQALINRANVEWLPIDILDYAEFTQFYSSQPCDIVVAPLQDQQFNRAKSSIKFLEYSSQKKPGVYSKITPYESIIQHGKNGFLAQSLEEWQHFLGRLIINQALRRQIAQSAFETVKDNWLISGHVDEWKKIYEQTIALHGKQLITRHPSIDIVLAVSQQVEERQMKLEKEIKDLNHNLVENQNTIQQLKEKIDAVENELTNTRVELQSIQTSRSWKFARKLAQIRQKVAPAESTREKLLQSMNILSR